MSNRRSKGYSLIELIVAVALIGVLAAVAAMQYYGYVAKSQVSRVVSEAASSRVAVEACIASGEMYIGTEPGHCNPLVVSSTLIDGPTQVGAALPVGTGVSQVNITHNGATITAVFGNGSAAAIAGNKITWVRSGAGSWVCVSTASARYNSVGCPAE